jgi:hypothetical protein
MRLQVKTVRRLVKATLCMILMSAHAAFAQEQQQPRAGGYTQTAAYSQEVVSAARFAAREQRDLIFVESIKSAEVQVVAGRNYRIKMRVWSDNKLKDVTAVVYQNLKGEYSVTSWEMSSGPAPDASGFPYLYANSPVEQLMKAVDEAYALGRLARLDARRPYRGRVRIVITHSLGEDGNEEARTFRTLAQADRWLKSRERDGLPYRETRPLYECSHGSCEFDFNGGILHNHLYLQSVSYGFRRGRPYIKTIYLLDGD